MIDIFTASGFLFFKNTGEPVYLNSEDIARSLFCYNKGSKEWYWYRANGHSYRMTEFNIPAAVKMAVMLLESL